VLEDLQISQSLRIELWAELGVFTRYFDPLCLVAKVVVLRVLVLILILI
jgi:hypothetical protein